MADLTVDLVPTPGFVHVVLAVWVPDHGWLTTTPEPTHMPGGTIDEKVAFKARAGARAIMSALASPNAPSQTIPMGSRGNACSNCGGMMQPTGSCETCMTCGTSGGCS
jgi:hypothetical protein